MKLLNANHFDKPIELNHQKNFVRNTCSFDSIAEILARAVNDNLEYLNRLENSTNLFCGFIVVYMDSGASAHVYAQRCMILNEFKDPQRSTKKDISMVESQSPKLIRSFDVFCCLFDMWTFLMENEASMYHIKKCSCGNISVEEFPVLLTNHKIILEKGFRALGEAVLNQNAQLQQPCTQENWGHFASVNVTFNSHNSIEADVGQSDNLSKSLTCKIRDFPVHVELQNQKYRYAIYSLDQGI